MAKTKEEKVIEKAKEKTEVKPSEIEKISRGIGFLVQHSKEQDKRMTDIEKKQVRFETGRDDRFKEEARPEDISEAKASRENVDPKTVKLIDEILGEDFLMKIEPHKDNRPGFLLTITVPDRLSLLPMDERPVMRADGTYKKDKDGNVIMESYRRKDERSRALASTDSFDAIREYLEKVRANIVSTYTKLNRPIPVFQVKQDVSA